MFTTMLQEFEASVYVHMDYTNCYIINAQISFCAGDNSAPVRMYYTPNKKCLTYITRDRLLVESLFAQGSFVSNAR